MLRSRVRRHPNAAGESKNRGDIDDLRTAAARERALGKGLRQEEYALEIDVGDVIPILLGEFQRIAAADNARVVDQNVGAAGPGDRLFENALDRLDGGKIGAHLKKQAPL